MKKYKITYNERFDYNLVAIINAQDLVDALMRFPMEHRYINEIVKIEEVE